MERMRRCASTVKPPIETRAMSSIPRTSATSEIVSGLIGFDCATDAGVSIGTPLNEASGAPGLSNNAVTPVGLVTCPGVTSANSSRRLWGFSTTPTTWRSTPPTRQCAPTLRWNADATPWVTATWSAPDG